MSAEEEAKKGGKDWMPLESNPRLMNAYCWRLGMPKKFSFCDVYGVDEALLSMVPRPCHAVVLLFPHTGKALAHRVVESKRIAAEGQELSDKLFFMTQTVGNACGTIGVIHAIANLKETIVVEKDSFFDKFVADNEKQTPVERATALEENEEVESGHQEVAAEASSDVAHECNANLHFITFVCVDDVLYEFDGTKEFPINHGKSSKATLLEDACKVIQQFMARDPEEIRFNMAALTDAQEE